MRALAGYWEGWSPTQLLRPGGVGPHDRHRRYGQDRHRGHNAAHGFGMSVIYLQPVSCVHRGLKEPRVGCPSLVDLPTLWAGADFVSVAPPRSPTTLGDISRRRRRVDASAIDAVLSRALARCADQTETSRRWSEGAEPWRDAAAGLDVLRACSSAEPSVDQGLAPLGNAWCWPRTLGSATIDARFCDGALLFRLSYHRRPERCPP